jgi:hypothetical protein
VTVAASVVVSVPSTEDAEAFTETTGEELLPPHPERIDATAKMPASKDNRLYDIRTLQLLKDLLVGKGEK